MTTSSPDTGEAKDTYDTLELVFSALSQPVVCCLGQEVGRTGALS